MKTMDMVSFRAMISTFFTHKLTINDAYMKSSKVIKLTSKMEFVFGIRSAFKVF